MTDIELYNHLIKYFDVVSIITTNKYLEEAKKLNIIVPHEEYETMVVIALSYPYRIIKSTNTYFVPSFYTFGSDYHQVMQNRIKMAMKALNINYKANVDNHEHNERLAALVAKIGFLGKNQLIINKEYGSYIFLGIIFLDYKLEKTFALKIVDDCGDCDLCIRACPTNALDNGYEKEKCISFFNQEKLEFNDFHISKNYSLFGCDICQMVCPKNINKGIKVHDEFKLSNKEKVDIVDIFTLSSKEFFNKYENMAYLWRGKTIIMRNALQLISKYDYYNYLPLIKDSLTKEYPKYYRNLANKVIKKFENSV